MVTPEVDSGMTEGVGPVSVPTLTTEQRRTAHQSSLRLRRQRAAVRQYLAAEHLDLTYADLLAYVWGNDSVQGMKVADLLTSLPGVGPARAARLLTDAGISPRRNIRGVGVRQRVKLLALLAH